MTISFKKPYEISIWKDEVEPRNTNPLINSSGFDIYDSEGKLKLISLYSTESLLPDNLLNMTTAEFVINFNNIINDEHITEENVPEGFQNIAQDIYNVLITDINYFGNEDNVPLEDLTNVDVTSEEFPLIVDEFVKLSKLIGTDLFEKYIYCSYGDKDKNFIEGNEFTEDCVYVGICITDIDPDLDENEEIIRPDDLKTGDFIWYPLKEKYYQEKQIAIIGSDSMTSKNRAISPQLSKKIDGSSQLTFTLYTNYLDDETNEFIRNPFVDLLFNEVKIKLRYGTRAENKWYDFVIKNIEENSEENTKTYTAIDVYVNELGKTGYNIVLNSELENNQGTILELAEKVVADSDWEISKNSDPLIQFITEPLYEMKVSNVQEEEFNPCIKQSQSVKLNIDNVIYVPYSTLNEQKPYFQFIYHNDNIYRIDENGVIIEEEGDSYYGGYYSDNITYNYNEEEQKYTLSNNELVLELVFNNPEQKISGLYKGQRVVRNPKTIYDKTTEQLVTVYKKDNDDTIYYGYTTTEYIAPSFFTNLIIDGEDFDSIGGWLKNGTASIERDYFPKWATLTTPVNIEDYTIRQYLKTWSVSNTTNYPLYNSVIKDNLDVKAFNKNLRYVFRVKAFSEVDENSQISFFENEENQIKAVVQEYIENNDKFTPRGEKYFEFNLTKESEDTQAYKSILINSPNEFLEYKSTGRLYYFDETTHSFIKVISEDDYLTKSFYLKEDNYYYGISNYLSEYELTQEELESRNIGLFIYPIKSNGDIDQIWFEKVQFFPYVESHLYEERSGEMRPLCPGEYRDTDIITHYHYYEKPQSGDTMATINISDSLKPDDDYKLVYDETFSKIKSIEAAESNRFNIIQDLSEAFECWAIFDVEHDPNGTGRIVVDDYKEVHPTSFIPGRDYYVYDNILNLMMPYDYYVPVKQTEEFCKDINYYIKEPIHNNMVQIPIENTYIPILGEEEIRREIFETYTNEMYINENYKFIKTTDEFFDPDKEYFESQFTNYKREEYRNNLYTIGAVDEDATYFEYTPNRQKKNITFKQYITSDNYAGFKYGINLNSIQRTIDSNDIVTKLIVKDNQNEFGTDGYCSIGRATDNPTKQTSLYNFDYYINKGLLDGETVYKDLYGEPDTSGNLGYYYKLRQNQINRNNLINDYSSKQLQYNKTQSQLVIYDNLLVETTAALNNKENELMSFGVTYEDIISNDSTKIGNIDITQKTILSLLDTIATLKARIKEYEVNYKKISEEESLLKGQVLKLTLELEDIATEQEKINREFYTKYSRFIQEGSWTSEDYYDDNLYYYDALSVLNTSKNPQVTYTIDVIEVSQLDELEPYSFDIGDKTYVEDVEFFGNKPGVYPITPWKEEVIVTELVYNLDSPEENTITVQNYKTRFEDLFQRISASVASLEYNQGAYGRAAALINSDGTINEKILQNTFANGNFNLLNVDSGVIIDNDGIVVTDKTNTHAILKLAAGGIYAYDGQTWELALDSNGINIDKIKAGRIDTNSIYICNGNQTSFRWDENGINAYSFKENKTDYNKFVRLDHFGLYGVDRLNDGNKNWYPDESLEVPIYEQIKQNAFFGLTYDGFFMKSAHGDGYVEISDENDIKVKTYSTNYKYGTRYFLVDLSDEYSADENYFYKINNDEYQAVENITQENFDIFKFQEISKINEKQETPGEYEEPTEHFDVNKIYYEYTEENTYEIIEIEDEKNFIEFLKDYPLYYSKNLYYSENTGNTRFKDENNPYNYTEKTITRVEIGNLDEDNYPVIEVLDESTFNEYRIDLFGKVNDIYYSLAKNGRFAEENTAYYYKEIEGNNLVLSGSEEIYILANGEFIPQSILEVATNYIPNQLYFINTNYDTIPIEDLEIIFNNNKNQLFTRTKGYTEENDTILTNTEYYKINYEEVLIQNIIEYNEYDSLFVQGYKQIIVNNNTTNINIYETYFTLVDDEYIEIDVYDKEYLDPGVYYVQKFMLSNGYTEGVQYYERREVDELDISVQFEDYFDSHKDKLWYYEYTSAADDTYDSETTYYIEGQDNLKQQFDIIKIYFETSINPLYHMVFDYDSSQKYYKRYVVSPLYIKESKYGLRLKDVNNNTVMQTDDSGQLSLEGELTVTGRLQAHFNEDSGDYDLWIDNTGFTLGKALAYDASTDTLYMDMNVTFTDEDHMRSLVKELQEGTLQISIQSSNGIIFKEVTGESQVITVLSPKVFSRGKQLNDAEISQLGMIKWYKEDPNNEGEFIEITGPQISGNNLSIYDRDVADLATYVVKLESLEEISVSQSAEQEAAEEGE